MSFFSSIGSFFSSIRDWFADPKSTAAIMNVEEVATAIVCNIASASGLALSVEQLDAVKAHTGITNEIYTVSSAVCTAMGGKVVTSAGIASNVTAVTKVS